MYNPNIMAKVSPKELKVIWGMITTALRKRLSVSQYNAWVKVGTTLKRFDSNKECVLAVNNLVTYNWIRENVADVVSDILEELFGKRIPIKVEVDPKLFTKPKAKTRQLKGTILDPEIQFKNKVAKALKKANINAGYTFDNFIVGPSNQLAYAASRAVAQNLGGSYNPLFIYGRPGTGKTHLLQAIGEYVLHEDPEKEVVYLSSEMFLNELVSAIRFNKTNAFKSRYRNLSLLIVDDIQFISKWEATQEELFHTFDGLYMAGNQIVFASDRPPSEIPNIAERLRTRFEAGMVVDIQPPDLETRIAILEKLNKQSPVKIEYDVLESIAFMVTDNVRSLIGAYKRLTSYSRLTGQKIDRNQAEVVLALNYGAGNAKRVTPQKIIEEVAKVFHVTPQDITGPKRLGFLVTPRQVSMYLIRTMLNMSLTETAKALGRKDHTTVLHALRKVERNIKRDKDFQHKLTIIKSRLA